MREMIIAGNWKMNTNPWEGAMLARRIVETTQGGNGLTGRVKIVLFPPATGLVLARATLGSSAIELGSQNVHWEDFGAFTGEISASAIKFMGAGWCIVAHSERRQLFGETDQSANRRLKRALESNIRPIYCIGETLEQRDSGDTFKVLDRQIREGLEGIALTGKGGLVIAYEPVWAIGTGRTATPEQAQDAHAFIRGVLKELYGAEIAAGTVIQYGGSVNDKNALELLRQPDIDGALVGGASLDADKFAVIIGAGAKALMEKSSR